MSLHSQTTDYGYGRFLTLIIIMLSVSIFHGCAGGKKPSHLIEKYTIEYPSPSFEDLAALDETLQVERFMVAHAFNTDAMVYRPEEFKLDSYSYHRWRVNPGDMITDFLLRDLRAASLFKAVHSYRDTRNARFVVEGGVVDFLEVENNGQRSASLSLSITLLDNDKREITQKIVFQRDYTFSEQIEEKSPKGYVKAMSKAVENTFSAIIPDIYDAVKERQTSPL